MSRSRYTVFARALASALRFPYVRMAGYPTLVNLEVTKRCNARCDFCDYWKTTSEDALDDYVPVIRTLKPTVVMLTGGEPLLRRDLERIIRRIRRRFRALYLGVITHGGMLSVNRGLALWNAGLDQLSISLDFLDERHDRARGIPGLAKKILATAPQLVERGVNVNFNTVIKRDNLDQIIEMVHWADAHGVSISFSTYAEVKVGNPEHNVTAREMAHLRHVIDTLLHLRAEGKPILSSVYYLSRIPEFFEKGHIGECVAGRAFVTVTPDGYVKRCSEFPPQCHYTEWTPNAFRRTDCDVCWFSCRGETQAPITIERLKQAVSR